jgi:hypothetical protein
MLRLRAHSGVQVMEASRLFDRGSSRHGGAGFFDVTSERAERPSTTHFELGA